VKTVLVVDDEPDILRLVETVLTRAGHKVVTASNGERALEKVRKMSSSPDLLLTDVVMPGLSGPMIAEQLREQFPALKILFISAFEDRQVVRRYVKDPGYELISKPFHIEELSAKVQQLLEEPAHVDGGAKLGE
jgi:two-component system cell cycle sensor histidine kinase/response regulator CckA